ETMYGLIHEAQIRQMRFALVTEDGLSVEGTDTNHRTEYLHTDANGRPLSPAYRVITTDKAGRYEIEKRIFTDPDRQALVVRTTIRALKGDVAPYLLLEPHMANTGVGDSGEAIAGPDHAGLQGLFAAEGDVHLALVADTPFEAASVGFVGASDGLTDLADGCLDQLNSCTGVAASNIMLTGVRTTNRQGEGMSRDFVIGFGPSSEAAADAAMASLATGLDEVLRR